MAGRRRSTAVPSRVRTGNIFGSPDNLAFDRAGIRRGRRTSVPVCIGAM